MLQNGRGNGSLRIPVVVLPGGFSPRPPFSRFARRAVPGWAGDTCYRRAEGTVPSEYPWSCFLGDPPPDPRFLASLGALSLVHVNHATDDLIVEFAQNTTGRASYRLYVLFSYFRRGSGCPPGRKGGSGVSPDDLIVEFARNTTGRA
jgi:hypothetical protein